MCVTQRSLRAELRLSVLRGYGRLEAIRVAHELKELQLLSARMTIAAATDENAEADEWAPSAAEIEAACLTIQAEWCDAERENRWRGVTYVERRDREAIREYNRRYRIANAERLSAYVAQPQVRERNREYNRQYYAAMPESQRADYRKRREAKRELYRANQRARRAETRDERNAKQREWRAANKDRCRGYREAAKARQSA